MINHKLRILVLKHLNQHALSGYSLINEIHEQSGWKPSYGSMYPLLEQLRKERLVTFSQEGRRKVYSLTEQGRDELATLSAHHRELTEQARENMKLLSHLLGFDDKRHDEIMDLFFSAVQKGELPFKEIMGSTTRMKMVCWELYEKGLIKKHGKRINEIMERATKELEALK